MRLPHYEMPEYPRFMLGKKPVHAMKIVDFLRYVINRDQLSINEYLEEMDQDPFFLVAATGLGKTVAVPVHVLIRLMQVIGMSSGAQPRVWVVEPRIPIAVDQMKFMNSLWKEYLRHKNERPLPPLFGCISSATGHVNRDAPIKFVTTGIFELMAKEGDLTPLRDRVIIDEAHVTVEQNPGVELGIALARQAGVTIDYMSATVDTSTLQADLQIKTIIRADKQRHVIWKHNLLESLMKALPELLEATLVHPDLRSKYFPQPEDFPGAEEVTKAVLEPGRSHGMLAVVNSFAGEQSDVRRLADEIHQRLPDLHVLFLASEVVRNAAREREFKQRLSEIEAAHQNYVILATSVVEMGITFPTLDFVATMDSGYDQETIGDVSFPVIAPLGVNSLLQRMGRVGRQRPGIAYVSYEVGAEYAEWDDAKLNGNELCYEPIRFPMSRAPLMALAYYAAGQEWETLEEGVASLNLPSRLHENADRMMYLQEQMDMLEDLELAHHGALTLFGRRMKRWIGQTDLAYAVTLQRRLEEGCEISELMFWAVATALSATPLVTLRSQHDHFVDYEGRHVAIAHEIDVWSGFTHEDLALFDAWAEVASMIPQSLFGGVPLPVADNAEFDRWCNLVGLSSRKLLQTGKAVTDLWRLFCRINSQSESFQRLFGYQDQPSLAAFKWSRLSTEIPTQRVASQLRALPGTVSLDIVANEVNGFDWLDVSHGHSGVMSQDDTPLPISPEASYTGRIVPSREKKGAEVTWRVAHLGMA